MAEMTQKEQKKVVNNMADVILECFWWTKNYNGLPQKETKKKKDKKGHEGSK